jgi:ABC-type dipeptide/oligopeptide/nickel transport system permease component
MVQFLCRRLVGAALVMGVVAFLTFALLDLTPGDAAQTLVGESASASELAAVRHQMGLDAPLPARFAAFAGRALLHGDLGRSLISDRPVGSLVLERFGYTALLVLAATALALILGLAIGLLAASHPGGALDFGVMAVTGLGISLPSFWVAMLLIMVLSLRLGWLPVVGAGSPAHLVLPALSLALPTTAMLARLVRSSLLDVKNAEYVRVARAKGLTGPQVWRRHILRNGLTPVVTMLGLHLGHLLGGTFVIETIFAWPGLGRLVVQAVFDRDFPVIVGAVLLMAAIYQALNLLADMAHAWLDPRVQMV